MDLRRDRPVAVVLSPDPVTRSFDPSDEKKRRLYTPPAAVSIGRAMADLESLLDNLHAALDAVHPESAEAYKVRPALDKLTDLTAWMHRCFDDAAEWRNV